MPRSPKLTILSPLLIVVPLLGNPSPAFAQGDASATADRLGEELEGLVERILPAFQIPGMAVGLVVDGQLILAQGFGQADQESGRPVTPDTVFQIGSISKSFTATLAAQLAEEERLAFDQPLRRHLPHADLPETPFTLRHLATHTSGLPGDAPNLRRLHDDYPILAFSHFELHRGLAEAQLEFPPGSAWGYSNFGYAVLGHVLEVVTATPFEVLLKERLTGPLGMESTTVTLWPEILPRLATPYYLQDDGELVEYLPWDEEALAPAGGLASTLHDLGLYLAHQIEAGRGDGPLADLQEPRQSVSDSLSYGMGWFVQQLPGLGKVVSVGGDVDGYVGELVFVPEHGIGTIVLINSGESGPVPHLGRWLLASWRMEADPRAAEVAAQRRERLEGLLREASRPAAEPSAPSNP